MSGGYNNQHGYPIRYQESSEPAQYLRQNYGYPHHENASAFGPVSEEYLRQPPTAPYPTAPIYTPEPAPVPMMRMPEPISAVTISSSMPVQETAPRVIIVQQPPARSQTNDCCTFTNHLCRCIDCLLTNICYVLLAVILIAVLIALAIWLLRKHHR